MSYSAEISRQSPTCILFVIDQSTSMNHRLEAGLTKAQFLCDVLNKTLYSLVIRCTKATGVQDYFHVGIIAYSGIGARNALSGPLGSKILNPISQLHDAPLRIEERTRRVKSETGEILEQRVKFPIWVEPAARGRTSMCAGLSQAVNIVGDWCAIHPNAFPATVIHVTDGHPTDGNPEPVAQTLRSLATTDGHCLLFNLHIDIGAGTPIVFPDSAQMLADRFGAALFRMSSILPPHAVAAAKDKGIRANSSSRAFVFNASVEAIVDFFDIGTRASLVGDR